MRHALTDSEWDTIQPILPSRSPGHPFADGNKRVGLLAAYVFLQINGYELDADNGQAYVLVSAVAAGEIDEAGIALWSRDSIKPIDEHNE